MNYELLLRPPGQDGGFDNVRILESLSRAGFELSGEKPLNAVFELREEKLRVVEFRREDSENLPDDDSVHGLNLDFPLGSSWLDADLAVSKVFEVSQQLGALVFDPQAGRQVNPSHHSLVIETWHKSAGFQADVVGSVILGGDAPELLGYKDKHKSRMGLYLLGIIVLLSVVYLARRCSGADDAQREAYVNDYSARGGSK